MLSILLWYLSNVGSSDKPGIIFHGMKAGQFFFKQVKYFASYFEFWMEKSPHTYRGGSVCVGVGTGGAYTYLNTYI